MFPTVSIFGYNIQSMWLACVAGACVCCALVLFRSKKLALPSVDVTNAGAMGLVGVLIGGKILYLCTILPILMQYWGFTIIVSLIVIGYILLKKKNLDTDSL